MQGGLTLERSAKSVTLLTLSLCRLLLLTPAWCAGLNVLFSRRQSRRS